MKKIWALLLSTSLIAALLFVPTAWAASQYVYFETPLGDASSAKINNVALAVQSIDGSVVQYGETFSFNDIVGARNAQRGFLSAHNGRGVRVVGGGVAQAATTLYLALIQLDDIEYNALSYYGPKFSDTYVDSGYDAVMVDYNSGYDFSFTSFYPGTVTINMWMTDESVCCFLRLSGEVDVLVGIASTPVYGSAAKEGNIEQAASRVFGTALGPRDVFSFNQIVGPRTAENGYRRAVNGRGVIVVGGGVAQVASSVYLAVKDLDTVSVTQKSTYGDRFTETYVADPADAIMTDYQSDIDFAFRYTGQGELTLYTYLSDGALICEVYETDP